MLYSTNCETIWNPKEATFPLTKYYDESQTAKQIFDLTSLKSSYSYRTAIKPNSHLKHWDAKNDIDENQKS